MMGLDEHTRYYVYQGYADMGLGINGLTKIVSQRMGMSPISGDAYVFFGKDRSMAKILRWDTDGYLLYHKRLERGTFELPFFKPGARYAAMPYDTLSAILRGISLRSLRYRPRFSL